MADGRLVYSTDGGDRRRAPAGAPAQPAGPPADGIVRVQRTKAGRGGKTVTLVTGLPVADLATVARDLKRLCGTGGTVADGVVEIQGDHRERIAQRLTAQGHRVKLAGG